MNTGLGF